MHIPLLRPDDASLGYGHAQPVTCTVSGLGVDRRHTLLSRSVKWSWVIGLGPFHHDSSVSQTEVTASVWLLNEKIGEADMSPLRATHSPHVT